MLQIKIQDKANHYFSHLGLLDKFTLAQKSKPPKLDIVSFVLSV